MVDAGSARDTTDAFTERLEIARDVLESLRRALARHDDAAILMSASRLRIAMDLLDETTGVAQRRSELEALRDDANPMLAMAPSMVHGLVAVRQLLARVNVISLGRFRRGPGARIELAGQLLEMVTIDERELVGADLTGACLRDVNLDEATLDGGDASRAVLTRVRIGAGSAQRARFDGCFAEGCNFARANLDRSTWLGATVVGSTFDGAVLADARLCGAFFAGCSFRGADLRSINLGRTATAVGARFLRCDLRETSWDLRDLDGASLVDCKLAGSHGAPSIRGVTVVRPDLSRDGDGTRIGIDEDVLRNWTAS